MILTYTKKIFFTKELNFSHNWSKDEEKAVKDYSMFNQLCQDAVVLLQRRKEAYIFNQEQLEEVEFLCSKRKIEFTTLIGDGYIMLLRKEAN